MPVFGQFRDPLTETAYIRATRQAAAPLVRYLCFIAMAVLVCYFILNPLVIPMWGVNDFNLVAAPTLILVAGFAVFTSLPAYITHPVADLIFFALMSVCMTGLGLVLGRFGAQTGWGPAPVLTGNVMILLSFTMLGFVASVRWYLLWCVLQASLLVCLILLYLHDPSGLPLGLSGAIPSMAVALYANFAVDRNQRRLFALSRQLQMEKAKSEDLLYNALPRSAVERLRDGSAVADAFAEATVVFVDLVGSSALARSLSPGHLVAVLNRVFLLADRLAAANGVEKVKTIGDSYLAVAGTTQPGGAPEAMRFARAVISGMVRLSEELGLDLKVRIGVHSGPVVGGIIGETRVAYDYWGDTMNVASRLQSAASPNGVAVSRQTFFLTRQGETYDPPRTITLKGIGDVEVFDVRVGGAA